MESVSACAWLPSGLHCVSAGMDKQVILWDREGPAVQAWLGPRLHDLAVNRPGNRLVSLSSRTILITAIACDADGQPHLVMDAIEIALAEVGPATSLCLSSDDRYLLVNVVDEIHLWDLHRAQLQHRSAPHAITSELLIPALSPSPHVQVPRAHTGPLCCAIGLHR
jgi:WD40 repeat protein